jgi:hypothetical protein
VIRLDIRDLIFAFVLDIAVARGLIDLSIINKGRYSRIWSGADFEKNGFERVLGEIDVKETGIIRSITEHVT